MLRTPHQAATRDSMAASRGPSSARQGLAALLLLLALAGPAAAQYKDFRQKWALTRQDIIVAMPVDKNHLTLAKGSRVWRRVRPCLPVVSRAAPVHAFELYG